MVEPTKDRPASAFDFAGISELTDLIRESISRLGFERKQTVLDLRYDLEKRRGNRATQTHDELAVAGLDADSGVRGSQVLEHHPAGDRFAGEGLEVRLHLRFDGLHQFRGVGIHCSSSRSGRLAPADATSRASGPTVEERRPPGTAILIPGAGGDIRIEVQP